MIIPVRCFTCGKVLADKWRAYEREVKRLRKEADLSPSETVYIDTTTPEANQTRQETPEKQAMDALGLTRYCCRRHMLGQVDIIDRI